MAVSEIRITQRDLERLMEWMRRTGRPQTTHSLARRYIEMLREEKGIRDGAPPSR